MRHHDKTILPQFRLDPEPITRVIFADHGKGDTHANLGCRVDRDESHLGFVADRSAEVIDKIAAANGWSAATVKTMLHRLVRKGALSTEQVGKKYLYKPAVRRDACVRQASRSFLERVFGGDATPALIHLVKTTKLSPKMRPRFAPY